MKKIKINDDRHGRTLRTGINGRIFEFNAEGNTVYEVSDVMAEHLTNQGISFTEVSGDGDADKGSVEATSVPTGPHAVIVPAMEPRSVGGAGDQPGDVTASGGVSFPEAVSEDRVLADAEISDIRVAAERTAPEDASAARLAGEGEGGTEAVDPQSGGPEKAAASHEEPKADKPKKGKGKKK